MRKKRRQGRCKRFVALTLAMVMAVSPSAYAAGEAERSQDFDAILKEALAADTSLYPNGGIEFFISQLNEKEDAGKVELTVVRRGGTDKKASVDFKAVDVSATYGEDYLLKVKESAFVTRVLEAGSTGTNMMQVMAATDGGQAQSTGSDESGKDASVANVLANTQVSTKKSSLQSAKDQYLGTSSTQIAWTEVDAADKEAAEIISQQGKDSIEEFAENVEGVGTTLEFDKGEYKKTIVIDLIDDSIAEGDEQVMFMLSNVEGAELAGITTAYLNISDNEEEAVVFAMKESEIKVDRAEGVVRIPVVRQSGENYTASVIVGTGGISATAGVDYTSVKTEVVFTPGVMEQYVEIPLIKETVSADDRMFQVALDAESANIDASAGITTVTIAATPGEKVSDEDIEAQAATSWSDTRNLNQWNAYKTVTWEGFSGYTTILSNIDLSTADSITVTWRSDEGHRDEQYKYKDGCKKKTGTRHYEKRRAMIAVDGQELGNREGNKFGWTTNTFTLTNAMKKESAKIQLGVRAYDGNNNATVRVNKIVINYPGYQFTVRNTVYEGVNAYTEKIYCEDGDQKDADGHKFRWGNQIVLGQVGVDNVSTNYKESAVVHQKNNLKMNSNWTPSGGTATTNKNSQGVAINKGKNGNVYFVGYQLKRKNSDSAWSDIIRPEDFKFNKAFLDKYSNDYMHTGREFVLRGVYRPYTSTVYLQNSDTGKGEYGNNFSKKNILRCTMLDTIQISGYAKDSYSVKGFNLGAYGTGIRSANSANDIANKAEAYRNLSSNTYTSQAKEYAKQKYSKVSVANQKFNSVIPNVICFSPTEEYVFLNMEYTKPKVTVAIDPQNGNKDKGAVVYSTASNGSSTSSSHVLKGDKDHVMIIDGVRLNQEYVLNAVTENGYKAYFKDFTGDADMDGRITTEEEKIVDKYKIVRTASNGNAYTFRPFLPNTIIYYGFNKFTQSRNNGFIDGVVALTTRPVFGGKEETKAINGAAVSVNGMTTASQDDASFGGLNETGGAGYFSIASRDFAAGENVTVNIAYKNLYLTATQAVNAARIYKLDSYQTFGICNPKMYKKVKNSFQAINANAIVNSDNVYRITLDTVSGNPSLTAKKAVFRFYRNDGRHIDGIDQTVSSSNGSFTVDFNPATLKVPVGATMTVQLLDQNGVGYYEHELGFSYGESLGLVSFLSSFQFGGLNKAISLVGTIDSAFNFGWDGNMEDSDKVHTSEDGNTKTLSIGFSFAYEKSSDDKDDSNQEQNQNQDAAKKDNIKEAAKSTDKNKKQNAAKDSVDGKNQSNTKVGVGGNFSCSFSLGVTMEKSQKEGANKGKWYFKEMILCAKAAGEVTVNVSYMTPVGIPVLMSMTSGASGQAVITIDQNYQKDEYYFSNVKDSSGNINLLDCNMSDANRAFDIYGAFNISPYIDLAAGTGFDFLSLMIGGKAAFDLNFFTDPGVADNGNVNLSAYVKLKVLFFEKKFEFVSKNYNLFGGKAQGLAALTDEDYRYESLSQLEVSDRAYLANRGEWNGDMSINAQSVAENTGLQEFLLLKGCNPNPDIQMVSLSGDKYLAVFVDDVAERAAYNSTAVKYTVYADEAWSEPVIIENDGTTDEAPSIFDLGEKGIYVAWSSADQVFETEPTVLENLSAMNIHGAFFDKTTLQFGEIQEVTKTAPYEYDDGYGLVCDNTADVNPHVSYDAATNRMIMFYTKSEYSASSDDEEGLVGDVVHPYSVVAYRIYDFEAQKWIDTYDASEGVDEDYTKAWYGQRFVELAPMANIKESLTADGYWTETPEVTPYEPKSYVDAETGETVTQEPIITEFDCITYNGLAVFTYVMDHDANQETLDDRDIYVQVYNFAEDSFTHNIRLTNDNLAESNLRLAHIGETADGGRRTFVTYLSDDTIYATDISEIIRNTKHSLKLTTETHNGNPLYYLDKTAPVFETEDTVLDYAYSNPEIVAGKNAQTVVIDEAAEDTESAEDEAAETAEAEPKQSDVPNQIQIADFDVASSGNYVYAIWTQKESKLKAGVEPNSEEAEKGENYVAESQIYVVRFDRTTGMFTQPVQVTDEEGANYDSVGFVVKEGDKGEILLLAAKAQSVLEQGVKTDEADMSDMVYPVVDAENRSLVSVVFTPSSVVTEEKAEVAELTAGTESIASIIAKNDGLDTLRDVSLTVKDEAGNVIYPVTEEEKAEAVKELVMGGEYIYFAFPVALDEKAAGTKFTYEIKDASENVLLTNTYEEEIPVELAMNNFNAAMTERGTVSFEGEIENTGRRTSGEQEVQIYHTDKDGNRKVLASVKVPNLTQNESYYFTAEYTYSEYSELFNTVMDAEDANQGYEAKTVFTAEIKDVVKADSEITLYASPEQVKLVNSVKDVVVTDEKNFAVQEKEVSKLTTLVETVPYAGGRYDEANEGTQNDGSGFKTIYATKDTDMIELYDSGYYKGLKEGTATVDVYVLPVDNQYTYSEQDGSLSVDNFATLPEEAILKETVQIKVSKEVPKEVAVTKVTLNKTSASIAKGSKIALKATLTPSDATNQKIKWTSSNSAVAKVGSTGVVAALKTGTATITATAANGKKATCKVTVTSVGFSKTSVTIGKGETFSVTPSLYGSKTTDRLKDVQYKVISGSKYVTAKKTNAGVLRLIGKAAGTATVRVTTKSKATATLTVKVKPAPTKITASQMSVKKGASKTIKYSLNSGAASANISYKISDTKIATVKNGKVYGVKAGTTYLTISTFNKKSVKVKVVVK